MCNVRCTGGWRLTPAYLLVPLALQLGKDRCQVGLALVPAAPRIKGSCQVAGAKVLHDTLPHLHTTC